MKEMNSAYAMANRLAQIALDSQVVNEEDYVNEKGILVCGRCHQPKRKFIDVPTPTTENPELVSKVLTTTLCDCTKEESKKKAEEQQKEESREVMRRLRNSSLMDAKFETSTFATFKATKANERNLALCKRYVNRFNLMKQKNQGLLFLGNVGTGKSFAAACIANALMQSGVTVVMTSFIKILEEFDRGELERQRDIMDRLNTARLLILDDLGAERGTDYALEKVYHVVDSRYRSGRPLIITTNLALGEMMEESDIRRKRIYDRILETCYPMQFTGQSWRMKEANKRFSEMEKLLGED